MGRLLDLMEQVAPTDLPCLVVGATGTGKEVAARAIHQASERRGGPFVVFDGAASSPQLLEAELFGYERGAFTGAEGERAGLFEAAHGGTLFLDEVGELPLDLQTRLLRVVDSGEVRRIGSNEVVPVDVRMVAATHRSLDAATLRPDLLHRLAGAVFELPSLSERRADIPLLAESLLAELCPGASLEPSAKEWLSQQRWPGNVRELRNAIRRTALLAPTAQLTARHFQAHAQLRFRKQPSASIADVEHLPYRQARDIVLRRFEYRFLECAAQACGGDRKAMAKQLGVGLRTLRTMLRDHGLDARTQRPS